ncbi:MAG: hypothetical protein AAFP19_01180 [Bacteroidota bacterium]
MKSVKIKFLFGLAWAFLSLHLQAQSDKMVDLFTGDFRYQVPAMAIPSTEGPVINLNLSYRGGIQMNQKASWVGLGWDLPIGEIKRSVKGVPDEWNEVDHVTYKYVWNDFQQKWVVDNQETDETTFWGPLHFKDFIEDDDHAMDIYFSTPRVGKEFTYPDYDQYHVSGPGISGTMQTYLFDDGSLVHKDQEDQKFLIDSPNEQISMWFGTGNSLYNPPIVTDPSYTTCQPFDETPQFRFKNEFGGINVPFPYNRTTKSVGERHSFDSDANPYTGQINTSTNKAINSRNIVFFTNAEIRNSLSYINYYKGFINYPKLNSANRGHDEDIGAFQITTEAGMVFHYSLPVYINEEHNITFEMDDFDPDNVNSIVRSTKARPYVDSWKLTAITGPDFVDNAPKGVIGPEDTGYWVQYDYTLWESNFAWQTPYLDGNRFFGENIEAYKQLVDRYRHLWYGTPEHLDYTDTESISYGTKEMYYLNYIQTSSHTAAFVKSIRMDEMGKARGTTKPQSSLLLDRIVLVENEDLGLFTNGSNLTDSRFEIGNQNDLIHTTAYNANQTQIKAKTLVCVDLIHNYNLCKNYHGNVYNSASATTKNFSATTGGSTFTMKYDELNYTGSTHPLSGKLSLTSIKSYGLRHVNEMPPYNFYYSNHNPNFNLNAKDYWGYYKSDFNANGNQSPYTSTTSAGEVDAWSMVKILTPLGGYIELEYEADEYEGVGYSKIPSRIFKGEFTQSGSLGEGYMEIDDNQFFEYLNNYSSYNVSAIGFSCPDRCVYTQGYYYPPLAQSFSTIAKTREATRAHGFVGSDINTIEVHPSISNRVINLDLNVNCGYDGTHTGSATTPLYTKAIAAVRLDKVYGGGLRVKSLSTRMTDTESRTVVYKTEYDYTNGVASIEPERFTPANYQDKSKSSLLYDRHSFPPAVGYSNVTMKKVGADNNYTDLTLNYEFINYDDSRYTGGAVKSYGNVEDRMESNYAEYQRIYDNTGSVPGSFSPIFELRHIGQSKNISGFDYSNAGIGRLKKMTTVDKNDNLISEEINEYKDISYTGEVFHMRSHANVPIDYDANFFSVNNFFDLAGIDYETFTPFTSPNAKSHLTVVNTNAFFNKRHVNQVINKKIVKSDDATYTTTFLDFDQLTGLPKRVQSTDPGTGDQVIKETVYAHELYPEMGPKSINGNHKNLLSIIAREMVLENGTLIEGVNTTFRNNYPVRHYTSGSYATANQTQEWQPYKVFAYNGMNNIDLWRPELEHTLFNSKGEGLERKYFGDRYESKIYGYDDQYLIAEVTDAKYTECAFSGAEDPIDGTRFGGEVTRDAATILNTNTAYIHTGVKSVQASQNQVAFQYEIPVSDLDASRKYVAKVWVYDNGNDDAELHYYFSGYDNGSNPRQSTPPQQQLQVNGSGGLIYSNPVTYAGQTVNVISGGTLQAGNWHLLSITIDIPSNLNSTFKLTVQARNSGTATAYFDDFRFHPINSTMISYVYEPWSFLPEYVLGPENLYDRTEYDAIGQRHRTYRETTMGEKLLTEQTFNFARYSTGGQSEAEQQANPGDGGDGPF